MGSINKVIRNNNLVLDQAHVGRPENDITLDNNSNTMFSGPDIVALRCG